MPFTLVETVENNAKFFMAVPSLWVENGILMYPNKNSKNIAKLKQNDLSEPELSWTKYICNVKAANICSYIEAMELEKLYGDKFTDTESEERYLQGSNQRKRQYRRQNAQSKKVICENNYDLMFRNENKNLKCLETVVSQPFITSNLPTYIESIPGNSSSVSQAANLDLTEYNTESEQLKPMTHDYDIEITQSPERHLYDNETLLQIDNINPNYSLNHLNEKLDSILRILEVQSNDIAKTSVLLKEFCAEIQSRKNISNPDLLELRSINCPLKTVEEVKKFEEQLNEPSIKSEIVKTLSTIGGTSGNTDAIKIANLISAAIFEQKLLKEFSWTGKGSNGTTKVPFLSYTNIIQLFFDVVRLASRDYTHIDNKNFIVYTMLKYSTIRMDRQNKKNTSKRFNKKPNHSQEFKNDAQIQAASINVNCDDVGTSVVEEPKNIPVHRCNATL